VAANGRTKITFYPSTFQGSTQEGQLLPSQLDEHNFRLGLLRALDEIGPIFPCFLRLMGKGLIGASSPSRCVTAKDRFPRAP
jgi:hypothetical protein